MKVGYRNLLSKQDLERRITAFYTLGAIVITLIFSAMISLYGAWDLSLTLLAISCNNLPVLYLLRRKKYQRWASYYLIANGAFTMTFSTCFVGELSGPVTYWLGLLPLAGGLLLYRRGVLYGTVLAFVSILILSLRDFIPGVYYVLVPDPVYLIVSLGVFVTMISFISYFFIQKNALVVADQTRKLDHLLNIVTHDIANPLTLISGHAELLISQGHTSNAHTQALHRIARASDLINEILRKVRQIQAAKAGKLRIQTSAVNLAATFEQLRFIFEARLAYKQQTLRIDMPSAYQHVMVQAEPVMLLNEVLNNLVSNAMKFSPQGSTIQVVVTREHNFMRIDVRDQGIGIPRELLPFIFDDFRSTSRPGTDGETGTGFGLPLARHIVDAFGGSLHVTSHSTEDTRKPAGSVFTLRLPVALGTGYQAKAS
jgi:signal transduction histidine kinase